MNVNLGTTFKMLDGSALLDQTGIPLTMRSVIANTLAMAKSEMLPERSWDLAQEVHKAVGDTMDIKVEEVAQIKNAIKSHNWVPLVIAQAFHSFEG